jgi:hypothetical protein
MPTTMPEVRLGVENASNSILAIFVAPVVVPAEFFGQCPEWRTKNRTPVAKDG